MYIFILQVVKECAQKEGYDLDLSYRVLAICAANGDKFQPQAAGLFVTFICNLFSHIISKGLISKILS